MLITNRPLRPLLVKNLIPPVQLFRSATGSRPTGDQLKLTSTLAKAPIPAIFDGILSAQNVTESQARLAQRKDWVLRREAGEAIPDWQGWRDKNGKKDPGATASSDIPHRSNAKLLLGQSQDAARINQVLMTGQPYSGVGTHFEFYGMGKKGDYDFSLINTTALAQRHWNSPLLAPATKQHLAQVILNQEGTQHIPSRWLLGLIPETENHILMTETSRYLKNQLVHKNGLHFSTHKLPAQQYNNQRNGFNPWFVNHLSQFVKHDFDEYNARPYQAYTVNAIQNLYEFADDPAVKTSAQIVLDYMAVRYATQSHELRRAVPFRRRHNYLSDNVLQTDSQSARYALLAGNFSPTDVAKSPQGHMTFPALGTYQVPGLILDLMIEKGHNPYLMKAHHRNTEIVYAEEYFSLSAGGHYHRWSQLPFSKQENGNVMPTVLMLKNGSSNLSEMIRFLGRGDNDRINNTGVYENFACGIRPVVPESLEKNSRVIKVGLWKFIDNGQVLVAMHTQSKASPKGYAPSVGFLEAVDKSKFPTLETFMQKVLQQNGARQFQYYGRNRYTTSQGKTIEFEMAEPLNRNTPPKLDHINQWLIKRVWSGNQEFPLETNLDKWPLLDSNTPPEVDGENNHYVVKADGSGQVLVNNPALNQSLLLSLADQHQPIRIEQAGEIVNLAETAVIRSQGLPHGIQHLVELNHAESTRYLSLKWHPGSQPQQVQVYVQLAGQNSWTLAENRIAVYTAKDQAFRTEFDLKSAPKVQRVAFVVTGQRLQLAQKPEIYRFL